MLLLNLCEQAHQTPVADLRKLQKALQEISREAQK